MMLPGTNITLANYLDSLDQMPDGIHELRRMLNVDFDLAEEWQSQFEWMIGQMDAAYQACDRDARWRMIRALSRTIWPLALLNFALAFPRLARWTRLA